MKHLKLFEHFDPYYRPNKNADVDFITQWMGQKFDFFVMTRTKTRFKDGKSDQHTSGQRYSLELVDVEYSGDHAKVTFDFEGFKFVIQTDKSITPKEHWYPIIGATKIEKTPNAIVNIEQFLEPRSEEAIELMEFINHSIEYTPNLTVAGDYGMNVDYQEPKNQP